GKTNPISGRWQGAWGLRELRVFQTFLDNLRPICSGHRYPARRATLVAAWFKKPLPERPRRLAVKPPSAQALRVQASSFEQNRFAMGKTAISLVSPRPQQLAPSGRAQLRLDHRAPGRVGWRARTVSGCVNSAFLNISQHFTAHLFSPWVPNSTRSNIRLSRTSRR